VKGDLFMKHRFAVVVAICACAALVFISTAQSLAQTEKDAGNPVRYSGSIKILNKDTKTITLQHETTVLVIKYTDQTKYTYRNQPGSIDDVKEGSPVIVLIDPAQKKDMVALRIDVREKR
jgi:hypothetical protein